MEVFEVQFVDVQPAFDKVAGPAISLLNQDQRRIPPQITIMEFGNVNPTSRHSVIVPLYGRIEFLDTNWRSFLLTPVMLARSFFSS